LTTISFLLPHAASKVTIKAPVFALTDLKTKYARFEDAPVCG